MLFTAIVGVGFALNIWSGYYFIRWASHSLQGYSATNAEAAALHRESGRRYKRIYVRFFIGLLALILLGFVAAFYGV